MNRSRQDCTSGNWSGPAIQYDPLKDGKAQRAHACLTDPLETGSKAAALPISGYQAVRDQGYSVSRCHIIAHSLGGDGTREDNLFTCAQNPTNSPS
ncbi:hypothetical protein GCM10023080_080970 [Streptomyces pseudoechinosporeus]